MEKAKAVAGMFVGKHDFRTFMSKTDETKTVSVRLCQYSLV